MASATCLVAPGAPTPNPSRPRPAGTTRARPPSPAPGGTARTSACGAGAPDVRGPRRLHPPRRPRPHQGQPRPAPPGAELRHDLRPQPELGGAFARARRVADELERDRPGPRAVELLRQGDAEPIAAHA